MVSPHLVGMQDQNCLSHAVINHFPEVSMKRSSLFMLQMARTCRWCSDNPLINNLPVVSMLKGRHCSCYKWHTCRWCRDIPLINNLTVVSMKRSSLFMLLMYSALSRHFQKTPWFPATSRMKPNWPSSNGECSWISRTFLHQLIVEKRDEGNDHPVSPSPPTHSSPPHHTPHPPGGACVTSQWPLKKGEGGATKRGEGGKYLGQQRASSW